MMKFPAWVPIAFAAGFGGIAPNFFRVASDLQHGDSLPDVTYLIGVLMFFGMGAATALSFGETEAKKAFFLGLSLPSMFQTAASDLSQHANELAARLFASPVVYAAEDPPRSVLVHFNTDAPDFSFIFSEESGRGREEVIPERLDEKGQATTSAVVEVPRWATAFQVLVIKHGQLSEKTPVVLGSEWDIKIVPASLRGLKEALGAKVPRWSIAIGKKEETK